MIIDLDRYRRSVVPILQYRIKKNIDKEIDLDHSDAVADISRDYSCHIIAMSYYLAELLGMTEDLKAKIDRIGKYYQFPEVRNYRPKESI